MLEFGGVARRLVVPHGRWLCRTAVRLGRPQSSEAPRNINLKPHL